jgi:hypothetical protein
MNEKNEANLRIKLKSLSSTQPAADSYDENRSRRRCKTHTIAIRDTMTTLYIRLMRMFCQSSSLRELEVDQSSEEKEYDFARL